MKPTFTIKTKKHWYQKDKIELTKSFVVTSNGATFRLKKGFDSDGASIPRFLWWFSNPFDSQTLKAALVHDALYWSKLLPRKTADRVFYALMRKYETPITKALIFYFAVRSVGWIYFYFKNNHNTDKEIAKYFKVTKIK